LGEKKTLWATQLMSSLRRALRAAVRAGGNPDERQAVGYAAPDMPRTKTWELDFGRAFPRDEPLAGLMARLVVLHADLTLECAGIGTPELFDVLDRGREHYRRMHFFRSSTGSLVAVRDLLDQLMANPTFRKWLADEPEYETKFIVCKGAFDQRRQLFERIRNEIGEHVVEHVGATVHRFKGGDTVLAEVDRETGILTPRLAETFMLAALMPDVPTDQWDAEFRRIIGEVRDATVEGLRAMVIALHLYDKHYSVFPL